MGLRHVLEILDYVLTMMATEQTIPRLDQRVAALDTTFLPLIRVKLEHLLEYYKK